MSIDDLFAQLPEQVALGGPGPFVINLCASSAPLVQSPNRQYASYGAQLYQIKVVEDGRPRYRLRLGPFDHEHEADAALVTVRDDYPGALTATALAADLQVFESMRPPVPATPLPEISRQPAGAIPVLTLAEDAAEREPLPSATPRPQPLPTQPLAPTPVVVAPSPPSAAAVPVRDKLPSPTLETTQTVRALTPLELSGSTSARSFAIQLLLADQPPDPEAVPHLDLFSEYRLYAVSGLDQGRVKHALRLGFFADEAAANMVASYLSTYYAKPNVVRVSAAEKERFAERRIEARKDVGATGRHAVIEITGDLIARYSRSPSKA